MRQKEDFKLWVEKAFGYQLSDFRSLQDHKIIDCDLNNTMQMLSNYFTEKKKIFNSSIKQTGNKMGTEMAGTKKEKTI